MFKNKNIFVTGASSGIGKQISIDVAMSDGNLFMTGRNKKELTKINAFIHNKNKKASFFTADLINEEEIIQLCDRLPVLSGIVINAGIVDYSPVKHISLKKMIALFQINFFSNVLIIKNLLKQRKIKNTASIVFIGSISSDLGVPATAMYAASKSALTSFSKVLASELLSKKIRVNTVSPGLVKTKVLKNISEINKKPNDYPLGYGNVQDVSNQVLFLLSDKSKWITGTNIKIEGGYLLK